MIHGERVFRHTAGTTLFGEQGDRNSMAPGNTRSSIYIELRLLGVAPSFFPFPILLLAGHRGSKEIHSCTAEFL